MSPLSNRIQRPQRHLVFRRQAGVADLPVDGTPGGWSLDERLRCEEVQYGVGISGGGGGVAKFTFVPKDSSTEQRSFDKILAHYSTDDQVRVLLLPTEDPLGEPLDLDAPTDPQEMWASLPGAIFIFEGVLSRHAPMLQANENGATEGVTFVAEGWPIFDNAASEHLIRGRWYSRRRDSTPYQHVELGPEQDLFVVENPSIPAAFNFRGRPNKHQYASVRSAVLGLSGEELIAPVFTDEDDAAALYWTVREAIGSLLATWLTGPENTPLGRHIDLDADLVTALNATGPSATITDESDAWFGMDADLPEVNVHGMGVLDALAAVCKVAGFQFAVEPAPADGSEEATADRPYVLRMWRSNRGPVKHLDLDRRDSVYDDVEALTTANNVTRFAAMRDAREVVTEIYATARAYVETMVELKPLWNANDVSSATVNADLQYADIDDLKLAGSYHSRHVKGGSEFARYGQVGRIWGLDCKGALEGPYAVGSWYRQDPEGTDWVELLGLNGEVMELRAEQAVTDSVNWTKRVRVALPLKSKVPRLRGIQFLLEASEDAGANWSVVDLPVTTLQNNFGIRLDVDNLATVSIKSLRTGDPADQPDAADSWWGLMKTGATAGSWRFRLTCAIEADNAYRFDAVRRPSSGTRYTRGQALLPGGVEVVYLDPSTRFATSAQNGAWVVAAVYQEGALGVLPDIAKIAKRRQELLDAARLTGSATVRLSDMDRYHLGDRIASLRGRDYSLAVNAGSGAAGSSSSGAGAFPNVVGLTWRIGDSKSQGVELALDDTAMSAQTNFREVR